METIIVGEFKLTGINKIDIDLVIRKWNHLYWVSEWRGSDWRIVKYRRKDSAITDIKLTISEDQARELIKKLSLISVNSGFRSGFSWYRQQDIDYLNDWRKTKTAKRLRKSLRVPNCKVTCPDCYGSGKVKL